jgi:class 3 adenylate cyclase
MESFPPLPNGLGPGQRALAAIVFTDVVGFSARMQVDEEAVLALLDRDFAVMRKLCLQHSGTVLKSTGDGLLLYFSSAVHAVACALRMQKYFARKARSLPPQEVLTHRVGIHLGDVFLNDQDVMGDGVNIAARLPAEAEPGGICISQTVYDVVKNKLALQVTLLGPRDLKNIAEAIPIYRILLEAQELKPETVPPFLEDPLARVAPAAPFSPPPPIKTRKWIVVGGLVMIAPLVLLTWTVWRSDRRQQQEQTRAETARAALVDLLDSAPGTGDGYNQRELARVLADWREELRRNRSRAAEDYDFSKLADDSLSAANAGPAAKADAALRRLALERIKGLFAWMDSAMLRYNRDKPLTVPELSGAEPREIGIFFGRDHRLYTVEGGAVRRRNWTDLKPAYFGAIVVGVLQDAPALPPREIAQGAEIFALFYGLPEMDSALRHETPRRGQK